MLAPWPACSPSWPPIRPRPRAWAPPPPRTRAPALTPGRCCDRSRRSTTARSAAEPRAARDRDSPGDGGGPERQAYAEPEHRRALALPELKGQSRQRAAYQAADVTPDRDAGEGKTEDQVDDDQPAQPPQPSLHGRQTPRPHLDHPGAHEPEHRARGSDRQRVGGGQERPERARQQGG